MNEAATIYQVSDLVNEVRRLMEVSYPQIWIEGELSSLSSPASGHKYFTLKDESAQLRCAMFRNRASINRYKLKEGDLVKIRAKFSVYPARGDLQCIVQHVEEAGEGLLQRRLEELKHKLNQAGLFDSAHKLPIPKFAKHIAIVTSPTGAAVRDVLTTLKRRCPSIPITVYPAVVQGENAAESIISALNTVVSHAKADVVILTRGGGSLEDLWCFNDETLAKKLFDYPLPVVSAVGHEVDFTITDLIADFRAPTPTAAAEIISPDRDHLLNQVSHLAKRMKLNYTRLLEQRSQHIDLSFKQLTHPKQQLEHNRMRLNDLQQRVKRANSQSLTQMNMRLDHLQKNLIRNTPDQRLKQQMQQLNKLNQNMVYLNAQNMKNIMHKFHSIGEQLDLVSPLATMQRGFSIVRDEDEGIIKHAKQVKKNQTLNVSLATGQINCTVNSIDLEAKLANKPS